MTVDEKHGPASFDGILDPLPDSIRSVALELRRIIQATLPDADEGIYGGSRIGMALYSIAGPDDVVCGIQPTAGACKLFLHGWKSLVEHGYRLEGSGKHVRHIKFRTLQDIDSANVARMITIAHGATGH